METLTVNVSQVDGLETQASVCFADPSLPCVHHAVPFSSPVTVTVTDELSIWFLSGAEMIGAAVLSLEKLSLPLGAWVAIRGETVTIGHAEDVDAPRAFVTVGRVLDEQVELPSVDQSLLHSSDASFLSTASFLPTSEDHCSRPSLRQTLEQLQEKLERDRLRHSGKTKALQLKLISVRSAYEKDLWKFKLDRNHLERCFRLETNELKLGLEKATMGRRRDALVIEEMKGTIAAAEADREREAKSGLARKYEELATAYEESLGRLKQQNQALLADLSDLGKVNDGLRADCATAQTRILTLETTIFQLEQEIKRLKSLPPEQCTHWVEILRLRSQFEECEAEKRRLSESVHTADAEMTSYVAAALKKCEDDRASDRKSLLGVIEDLRSELNHARRNAVSLQTREAALATKLDSKRYSVALQRDISGELQEALAVNARLSQEMTELNERLEGEERRGREKEREAEEWHRKWDGANGLAERAENEGQMTEHRLKEAEEANETLKEQLAAVNCALENSVAALKTEKEKSNYLEAELSVSQEVMKTLKVTHETGSKESQDLLRSLQARVSLLESQVKEWETRHTQAVAQVESLQHTQTYMKDKDVSGLQGRIKELETAVKDSQEHCVRLEEETQTLAEKFTAEREALESERDQQEDFIQRLLDENQDAKKQLASIRDEKEELERLLNEAVSKIPIPKTDSRDQIDQMLREYMSSHKLKNPFIRIAEGLYTYGSKKVSVTVKNGSLIVRVGGGYMFIEEFLKMYMEKNKEAPTPKKVKIMISPRSGNSRSLSVGTEFKRTFTLMCDSRAREDTSESSSGFPTPQQSVDSPLRTQRSMRESSPTLYLPTVSSTNKTVSSPVAAKTAVFRAFKVGRNEG